MLNFDLSNYWYPLSFAAKYIAQTDIKSGIEQPQFKGTKLLL